MKAVAPDRAATPKQVRAYLTQALIAKHDVPPDQAKELASRWEYGRGSDLHNARVPFLKEILGDSLGPYFMGTLQDDLFREWRQSTPIIAFHC